MYWKDINEDQSVLLKDDMDHTLIGLVRLESINKFRILDWMGELSFIMKDHLIFEAKDMNDAKTKIDLWISNWIYNNFLKEE